MGTREKRAIHMVCSTEAGTFIVVTRNGANVNYQMTKIQALSNECRQARSKRRPNRSARFVARKFASHASKPPAV